MLFICNKIIENNLQLNCLQKTDAIIFIEDGVYNLLKQDFIKSIDNVNCYALSNDIAARQIDIAETFTLASYPDFVNLCIEHEKICQI